MAYQEEEQLLPATYDLQVVRRLFRYLIPYQHYAYAALLLTVCVAPLSLAGPPLVKAAVDLYLAPDPSKPVNGFELLIKQWSEQVGLGATPYEGVVFIACLFFVASIAALVLVCVRGYLLQKLGQLVMRDMRAEIFGHLQRLPVSFYDRTPVGRMMTRMTTDVEALNELFTSGVILVVGDIIMALLIVVYMLTVEWRLALISLLIVPLLVGLIYWFRRGVRRTLAEIRIHVARLNSFLQERLTGMSLVQLFNAEEREFGKFRRINEDLRLANVQTLFYYAFFYPAVEVISAAGIAFILWYGGGQVIQGLVTIGTLIAFIQLTKSFFQPVAEISEKFNVVQAAIISTERIFALLDEPAAAQTPETPPRLKWAAGRIEFRHVWFAYQEEEWVLKDVSFVVDAGESVALVGHTGAGKSTIVSLLLRFYEPQRGQILLDDVDISTLDEHELRSNFSIVLQDVFLSTGDIASNIRMGDTELTEEQLAHAARQVHADSLIKRLPAGLATEVNERGAGLSFGEKQLICFARAVASEPRVLILDEATRSIDGETEELITDAVGRLMKGQTSLIIAHRLSTIRSVGRIIVLHKGEVKEKGTHQELLAARGIYWRLYRLHFGAQPDEEEVVSTAQITGDDALAPSVTYAGDLTAIAER